MSDLKNKDELAEYLALALTRVVDPLGLEVLDVACLPGVLQITVEDPSGPIDSTRLSSISSAISVELDNLTFVDDVYSGRYALEVSSPGLERILKTTEHFSKFIGAKASFKLKSTTVGDRRFFGWILSCENDVIRVALDPAADSREIREIRLDEIEKSRTIYEWITGEKKVNNSKGVKQK